MNYTEIEIETIKANAFDKGWRYGLFTGLTIVLICFIVACILI